MTDPGATSGTSTILVVGPASGSLAEVARSVQDVELVADLDAALSRLAPDGPGAELVVLAAGTDRPLSAARRLRAADGWIGVALAVPAGEVETVRQRLALAPELAGVRVLGDDMAPAALTDDLHATATRVHEQRRVRHALDVMNRDLGTAPSPGATDPTPTVSERYLAALTRHLPEGVVSVDVGGRVVTMNPSAAEVFGVTLDEAERRPLTDLLVGDEPDAVHALVESAAGGRTAEHDDLPIRRLDGEPLTVSLTAAPVTDDAGQVVGIVLLVRDVTADRRTEERLRELQKAESLATLAGGVAHDFNNLLVSVQSWAGMAAEDVTDGELVTTALEHIRRASRRAAELARSMLAYAGRGTFELEPTDLNDVVGEMSGLLKAAISRKTEVVFELTRPLPPVLADATQVRQVVMNLVTNAAEAIGDEPGSIRIRTAVVMAPAGDAGTPEERPVLHPGTYVLVEVEDTGAGMDEATRSRIFDPFFTTKFTGRGLGLAASHGIVRAHGGDIEVSSEVGGGSVFRVLLPAEGGSA